VTSRYEKISEIAGPVSRETVARLEQLEALVLAWTRTSNLIAPSTIPHVWERHILDSAQLVPLAPKGVSWMDLGSGGGFPALVVALLTAESGGFVHMVESNAKKAAFLRLAVGKLGLPAEVHHSRIENPALHSIKAEVVTSRALASLDVLFGYSAHWLSAGAVGLFHKGRDFQREIEEAAVAWDATLIQHPSAIEADSVILEVRSLRRR